MHLQAEQAELAQEAQQQAGEAQISRITATCMK
jgi:hypothetical protein